MARTFAEFDCLEVQRTFDHPPRPVTAERWRAQAPAALVFAVQAWQLITHEASSPTYRRLSEGLTVEQRAACGRLGWNATTAMAWQRTQDVADALAAEAVVLQTPKSFHPSPENLADLRTFLAEAHRRGRTVVLEPRREAWEEDLMAELARELDLVHGVDPFLRSPAGEGLRYFRRHGRPAYHYRYRYIEEDLDWLAERLRGPEPARVLFNNDRMAEDGRRLKRRLARFRGGRLGTVRTLARRIGPGDRRGQGLSGKEGGAEGTAVGLRGPAGGAVGAGPTASSP